MADIVSKAFEAAPRESFLLDELIADAKADKPLPIGYGQTNSQPSTVRSMLEWLEVKPGNKILDIGSGSGWTTALLAHMAGPEGHVVGVELVEELLRFGRNNCERLGITNVTFHKAGKQLGWPPDAPYDRILVSASASEFPLELSDQLKPGGKMVVPIVNEIYEITKAGDGELYRTTHTGFIFVPLITTDA